MVGISPSRDVLCACAAAACAGSARNRIGAADDALVVTCLHGTSEEADGGCAALAGDGLISAHETCISAHDFRIVAGFGKLDIGDAALDPALAADLEAKISPHDLNRLLQVDKCLVVQPF